MRFDEFHARNAKTEPTNEVTEKIIGAAIEVHREMGPGLTEVMYEGALCREFDLRGIRYARQVPVAVSYKGVVVGEARIDLIVEGEVIVELKACDGLSSAHRSQCITYLRATGHQIALLINFNVPVLRDGIKRVILSQ
jgi:GxxExxY protein